MLLYLGSQCALVPAADDRCVMDIGGNKIYSKKLELLEKKKHDLLRFCALEVPRVVYLM